jgi:DNA invertase Pin-like site-specific DNA recombinase
MKELLTLIEVLKTKDITFVSLTENMDISTASYELILHILASLAQFKLKLIVERSRAGLASARARRRVGGRPITLIK